MAYQTDFMTGLDKVAPRPLVNTAECIPNVTDAHTTQPESKVTVEDDVDWLVVDSTTTKPLPNTTSSIHTAQSEKTVPVSTPTPPQPQKPHQPPQEKTPIDNKKDSKAYDTKSNRLRDPCTTVDKVVHVESKSGTGVVSALTLTTSNKKTTCTPVGTLAASAPTETSTKASAVKTAKEYEREIKELNHQNQKLRDSWMYESGRVAMLFLELSKSRTERDALANYSRGLLAENERICAVLCDYIGIEKKEEYDPYDDDNYDRRRRRIEY